MTNCNTGGDPLEQRFILIFRIQINDGMESVLRSISGDFKVIYPNYFALPCYFSKRTHKTERFLSKTIYMYPHNNHIRFPIKLLTYQVKSNENITKSLLVR